MLKEVGIDTDIKYYPGDQLFAPAGMGGILQLGKFDLAVAGWYSGIDPDDSSQFMCKNFPPGGYNYTRYCNRDMQAAQRVALTHYDRPSRRRRITESKSCSRATTPKSSFGGRAKSSRSASTFKGFDPNPVTESWNAWQWSI